MPQLKYSDRNRHATWLELFFDLILVACVGTLTHHLSDATRSQLSLHVFLDFLGEFAPLWWIWASHTYYCNRFDTDSKAHRFVTLIMFFLMAAMGAYVGSDSPDAPFQFVAVYILIRFLQAGMYLTVRTKQGSNASYANLMAGIIVSSALVSGLSLLTSSSTSYALMILVGVVLEMSLTAWATIRHMPVRIHLPHLVERVGLLSLILLGESVISLAAALRGIAWNQFNTMAAVTGFTMTCAIWWIYFDSFYVLERAKRIKHGFVVLYSHIALCMGLVILAILIRQSILGDIDMAQFRILAITGMTLFYIGKQFSYFVGFPIYRINNVVNSTICISITVASTYFSRPEYALIGMTVGMLFYVYSNFKWTLVKDASEYLVAEDQEGVA